MSNLWHYSKVMSINFVCSNNYRDKLTSDAWLTWSSHFTCCTTLNLLQWHFTFYSQLRWSASVSTHRCSNVTNYLCAHVVDFFKYRWHAADQHTVNEPQSTEYQCSNSFVSYFTLWRKVADVDSQQGKWVSRCAHTKGLTTSICGMSAILSIKHVFYSQQN